MRFDSHIAYPYPVLRPNSDDYHDAEFQTTVDTILSSGKVTIETIYALSSDELHELIDNARAEFVTIITCRDTYFRSVLRTSTREAREEFDASLFRGEVRFESYIVVINTISGFTSPDINIEFGGGPFDFVPGNILSQDEPQSIFIERELFGSVGSVFDLIHSPNLSNGEWGNSYDQDHIQIRVSIDMKSSIDSARNDKQGKVILINSIYFSSVTQAIQMLKDTDEFDDYKWAKVIRRQAHNSNLDITKHESSEVAQRLMSHPLSQLRAYVFQGDKNEN